MSGWFERRYCKKTDSEAKADDRPSLDESVEDESPAQPPKPRKRRSMESAEVETG